MTKPCHDWMKNREVISEVDNFTSSRNVCASDVSGFVMVEVKYDNRPLSFDSTASWKKDKNNIKQQN